MTNHKPRQFLRGQQVRQIGTGRIFHVVEHVGAAVYVRELVNAWLHPSMLELVESPAEAAAVAELVRRAGFDTPETRGSDRDDFREVSVSMLVDVLRRAFAAGRASK